MSGIYRVDSSGQIKSYEESPQGYLTCFMTFSRVGDLLYRREDGRVETEYVSEQELFDPVSLATVTHKPILKGHPSEPIDSSNIRKYLRGTTSSKVIVDAPFVTIVGVVHDEELISSIKSGQLQQVSAGYFCNVKKDESGRLIQTQRRYDHLAICESGRAGPQVKVHYDSSNTDMKIESDSDRSVAVRYDSPLAHLRRQDIDSTPKWQRPLSLSRQIPPEQISGVPKHQQPLRLSKESRETVPRVKRLANETGPFTHLRKQG